MDEGLRQKRSALRVIAPPPLIALGVVLLGLSLDRLFPIGVAGAVFQRSTRAAIATALIAFAAWPMARALWRFRLAGTPVEPWKPASALVVRGIFKRTRNPVYQAFGLSALGLAFAFASDWIFLLLPFGALVMHFGVVLPEERYLGRTFGDAYRDYRAKVPRYGWPL